MIDARFLAVTVASGLVLAACDGNPLDPLPTVFDRRVSDGVNLLGEISELGDATATDLLPDGTATYQGFAGFMLEPLADVDEAAFKADPGAYADYVSSVTINVDFGSGVTGGSFSNFADREGAVAGSLVIEPAAMADVGGIAAFATNASGKVDGGLTDVGVEAYFVGSGADGVLGRGQGTRNGATISHYFAGLSD